MSYMDTVSFYSLYRGRKAPVSASVNCVVLLMISIFSALDVVPEQGDVGLAEGLRRHYHRGLRNGLVSLNRIARGSGSTNFTTSIGAREGECTYSVVANSSAK
jgi:hypothetical protein